MSSEDTIPNSDSSEKLPNLSEEVEELNKNPYVKDLLVKIDVLKKGIISERKKNSSYMPEDKKPQPIKNSNPPSYEVSNQDYNNNYYGQNNKNYQVQNNYQGNAKSKNTNNNYNNNSMMNGDTFDKRLKMFGK